MQCLLRGSQNVAQCVGCERLTRDTGDSLRCRFPTSAAAATDCCGAIVPTETVALDSELPVREALTLLENARLTSAPVVDDEAHVIGVATTLALTKALRDSDAEVEDVVEPTLVVNEHLEIVALARLMEERQVERVSIVDDDGRLLGVVSAFDLLRWLRETR